MEKVTVRNVDGNKLRACFTACQHAISTDSAVIKYTNYYIRLVCGGIQVIATDGFRLAMREIDADHNIDETVNPFSFGVAASSIKVAEIPQGSISFAVSKKDNTGAVAFNDSLVWPIETFWYPNINTLLSTYAVSARVSVSTKDFCDAVTSISKSNPVTFKNLDNDRAIGLTASAGSLLLSNNNAQQEVSVIQSEILAENAESVCVHVQKPFLKDILKNLVSAESVEIYFLSGKLSPAVVLELSKESVRQSLFIIMGYKLALPTTLAKVLPASYVRIPSPSGEPCACTFSVRDTYGGDKLVWLEEGDSPEFLEKYYDKTLSLDFKKCYRVPADTPCYLESRDERAARAKREKQKKA